MQMSQLHLLLRSHLQSSLGRLPASLPWQRRGCLRSAPAGKRAALARAQGGLCASEVGWWGWHGPAAGGNLLLKGWKGCWFQEGG